MPEWSKGYDSSSYVERRVGSNPTSCIFFRFSNLNILLLNKLFKYFPYSRFNHVLITF